MPISRDTILADIEKMMNELAFNQSTRDQALQICETLDFDKLVEAAVVLRTKKAHFKKMISDPGILAEVKKTINDIKTVSDKYGISS